MAVLGTLGGHWPPGRQSAKVPVYSLLRGPNLNFSVLNFFKKFGFASFLEKNAPKTFVLGPPEKAKTFDLKVCHPKKKV